MNRYTFKAKRKDNREWVYGYLIDDNGNYCIMVGGLDVNFENLYTIDKDTICQCTGLQDMDDKDIFENDILPMGTSIIDGKEEIIFDTVKYVYGIYEPIAYWKKEVLKVVGNKFDKEED